MKNDLYLVGPILGVKINNGPEAGFNFSGTTVDEEMSKFRIKQLSAKH